MSKRWLFVTYSPYPKRPILDPSARYRCFHRVEDLRALGRRAAVISQQRFERDPPLDFDVYVFHRPWHSQDFEGLLDYLRARGKRLVADYDDPVFSAPPRTASPPPFPELRASGAPPETRFLQALRCFDVISVATRPLADWVAEVHPAASILEVGSGLGASWIELADSLATAGRSPRTGIALGPGDDVPVDPTLLRQLIPALRERAPRLRLVPGRAARAALAPSRPKRPSRKRPEGLLGLASRCQTMAFPSGQSRADRTLPAVRALEAAWLGCRVVAPPLPDFLEHRDAGFVLVDSIDAWMEALLEAPAPSRAEIAARAREHLRKHGLSGPHTQNLIDRVEAPAR
jgi:hypothetical protein